LPYSVAQFINPKASDDILRTYRREFKPSATAAKPYGSIGIFVMCADTEAEARRLEQSRQLWLLSVSAGRDRPTPSVEEAENYPYTDQERALLPKFSRSAIIGAPEQPNAGLGAVVPRYGADEVVPGPPAQ